MASTKIQAKHSEGNQDELARAQEHLGFPCGSAGKESACKWENWVLSLGWGDPLEKGKATHSRWPGDFHGLYSPWGLQRVRHD